MKKQADVKHEKTVQDFVAEAKEKQALQAERQKSGTLMKRILELEKELEVLQALKGTKSHYKIVPAKDGGTEAVAVIVASDWHIYALSIKASPEPPVQAFFLVDSQIGKTIVAPIILTQDR